MTPVIIWRIHQAASWMMRRSTPWQIAGAFVLQLNMSQAYMMVLREGRKQTEKKTNATREM